MSSHANARLSQDLSIELPWPPAPANDPVVLSSEPFDGALRLPTPVEPEVVKKRPAGLIALASVGSVSVAVFLAVNQFNIQSPRASTTVIPMTTAAKTSGSVAAQPAIERSNVAATAELTAGLDALRSKMQTAQAPEPALELHARLAAVDEPALDLRPDAVGAAGLPVAPSVPATQSAAQQAGPTAPEVGAMLERARALIAVGDIAAARRLAEYASVGGDGRALFTLAETFDPAQLARWRVRGVRADVEKARDLYGRALISGVAEAGERVARLP